MTANILIKIEKNKLINIFVAGLSFFLTYVNTTLCKTSENIDRLETLLGGGGRGTIDYYNSRRVDNGIAAYQCEWNNRKLKREIQLEEDEKEGIGG